MATDVYLQNFQSECASHCCCHVSELLQVLGLCNRRLGRPKLLLQWRKPTMPLPHISVCARVRVCVCVSCQRVGNVCIHAHQNIKRHNQTIRSDSACARAESPPAIRNPFLPETTSPQARDPRLRARRSMPRAPAGSACARACVRCHACFVLLQVPSLHRRCCGIVFFRGIRLAKTSIDSISTSNFRARPLWPAEQSLGH